MRYIYSLHCRFQCIVLSSVLKRLKMIQQVSRLVASEVIRRPNLAARIAVIEKWTAVADICRCLHNL